MNAKNILGWATGMLMGLLLAMPVAAGDPVMSLQPLHPGREVVLEPAFEGEWVYASVNLKLNITRAKNFITDKPDDYYTLTLTGADVRETLRFEAHLVRLGSTVFADIRQTSEAGLFALYPHVFAKLRVDGDELHFDFLDDKFVRDALENGRANLLHEQMDGTLVLTAPTRELQDFVESCAFDDKAFNETVSFTRMKEQQDPSAPSQPG